MITDQENSALKKCNPMNFKLFIAGVALALVYSCSPQTKEANNNPEIQTVPKKISLEGQANFRDLGGYKTAQGQSIKYGMLFRSGTLSQLTDSDIAKLEELKIKTVVNFLTEEERAARGEDKLPEGVKSIFLPISGENNEASLVLKARQTGDFSEVPSDFNYKIHDLLTEVGEAAYAGLFDVLSNEENYPVVFHCSHGVHRTGTASALVLSALGINWDTIEKDYLLSNDFRKSEIDMRIQALKKLASENPTIEDEKTNLKNIEAFYRLKPEYIEGTKKAVERDYGGFDGYFDALGISESKFSKMQNILLEKQASN